jgi:hypothetical protein
VNQLFKLTDHVVVWAVERPMRVEQFEQIQQRWSEMVGDDPKLAVFPETRVVLNEQGQPLMFEFTGDVTPTFVAEFKRWWEEAVK